jgi:hypothetical protein
VASPIYLSRLKRQAKAVEVKTLEVGLSWMRMCMVSHECVCANEVYREALIKYLELNVFYFCLFFFFFFLRQGLVYGHTILNIPDLI